MPKSISIIISGGGVSEVVSDKKYNRKSLNKKNKIRNKRITANNTNSYNNYNSYNYHGGLKIKARYKILIFLILIFAAAFGIIKYSEVRIRPIITSMAEAHARTIGARVVGEALNEEMAASNLTYDDLMSFEKDANGKISALKTNIIMVNKLKSKLSVLILNKLLNMSDINLYIPIGNLVSGEFFSGRGPKIEIILLPVGSVTTNITNAFSSAGINQTRHQIILEVRVTVSIIMPFSVESTDISTSISIAETIIVGDVPNMYMEYGDNGNNNIKTNTDNTVVVPKILPIPEQE